MLTIRIYHQVIWWLEVIMSNDVSEEWEEIEYEIPLMWGCWIGITFLLFFAFIVALVVTVVQG